MSTIAPIEVVFGLSCLIGIGFDVHTFVGSLADLRTLRIAKINGAAMIAAREYATSAGLRLFCLALGVVVGVTAMLLPQVEPVTQPAFRRLVGYTLFVMVELIVLKAILAWRFRRQLTGYLEAHAIDDVAAGMEQLHQDNVDAAAALLEADAETVRKVKPVDRREN